MNPQATFPTIENQGSGTVPVLRRLELSDANQVLAAFMSDPEMVRQGDVTTLLEAQTYIQTLIDSPTVQAWGVDLGGLLAGLICINVDEENRTGWFSYWMAKHARGQGITARAAATVADWALSSHGLERLELGHRANNPASGAIAVKAGFVHEGTEREKFLINGKRIDVLTYGRLLSDPAPAFIPLQFLGA